MTEKSRRIYEALSLRPGNKVIYNDCKYTVKNVIPIWKLDVRGAKIFINLLDTFATIDFFFHTNLQRREDSIREVLLYAGFKEIFDVEILLEKDDVVCYASHDDVKRVI